METMRIPVRVVLLGIVLAACGEKAASYRVPKEQEEPPAASPLPAEPGEGAQRAGEGASGNLHWNAPKEWKELPSSGMRLATFTVPAAGAGAPADLSVVALPGDAGGELANVNRWRGQLGLGPLDVKGLERESMRLKAPAGTLLVVEYAGPKGRLHAAILDANGNTWFFKLTGDDATVAAARSRYLEFLKSLHF